MRAALAQYTEGLQRSVGEALLKSRTKLTPARLRDEVAALPQNPVHIDRRVKGLSPAARALLALMDLGRATTWPLGSVVELAAAVAPAEGMPLVFSLLEAGFLYPDLPADGVKIRSFEEWLGRAHGNVPLRVWVHPQFAARAAGKWDDIVPPPAAVAGVVGEPLEADGLELPLRLGVLWQQVHALPLRLTLAGEFFKRDQDRLAADPLLNAPFAVGTQVLPDLGHAVLCFALGLGLVQLGEGEILAAESLAPLAAVSFTELIERLLALTAGLAAWTPAEGWRGLAATSSPFGTAAVLALAALAQLPPDAWTTPADLADWLRQHHCYWRQPEETLADRATGQAVLGLGKAATRVQTWAEGFLLGLAFQLRLTQIAAIGDPKDGRWAVRLSPLGRTLATRAAAAAAPEYPKTLLVQPNLEILAYRQGLGPKLIAELSQFATWKTLGAACTLNLEPGSVYRGLETGGSHDQIMGVVQRHGVREVPPSVVQALRTWADKRDRLTVYAAGNLLEFASAADLEAALGRGQVGVRVAERFLLVAREEDLVYRHYRLVGTRDYALPPTVCVELAEDGVTLTIDAAKADLLVETEVQRFGQLVSTSGAETRVYRLTPESVSRARSTGLSLKYLEDWFPQRTGQDLSPAARVLYSGGDVPAARLSRLVVLEVASPVMAEGLLQWPGTRDLIAARLGPVALAVPEAAIGELRVQLRILRVGLEETL